MSLFKREFSMNVGGTEIPAQSLVTLPGKTSPQLGVEFAIERNDNRDPNVASLKIHNLSAANRKLLQQGSELAEVTPNYEWPLIVKGGYLGGSKQLFSGDISFAQSHREGVTWVTEIEARDGGKKYSSARFNQTFGPGTTVQALLTFAAIALGVGLGNSAMKFADARRGFVVFKKSVTVTGRVSKTLDRYIGGLGFDWSIQDGQLQVLGPNEVLVGEAIFLSAQTGLIGAPERGEKGSVTFKSLLNGDIIPGRQVILSSDQVTGPFRVTRCGYIGNTWGNDWYTEAEGVPLA